VASDLPLLRRHPKLRALPRFACLEVPTPVEPLALHGAPSQVLWVKRDDACCPLYGGNKPRKLEFVIGEARARGAHRLVTTGGLGTHHGLATTLLGREAGLPTTVVLVDQPWTDHVRDQLCSLARFGAEIVYGRNLSGAGLALGWVLGRARLRGERPMLVPVGGSSPLGAVGFVSAAIELAEQIEAGTCPAFSEIYVAVGSGGTLAGLVLGAKLARLSTHIVGVLVTDRLAPGPARLARLARATWRRLRGSDPSIPSLAIEPSDFEISRAQLGPGYGASTPAACEALEAAAQGGLELETTYTAKCLAEVRSRLVRSSPEAPVLFWNTYNSIDLSGCAPTSPPLDALPPALRARVAGTG
jgi:D-cysteine desulfhydrase